MSRLQMKTIDGGKYSRANQTVIAIPEAADATGIFSFSGVDGLGVSF